MAHASKHSVVSYQSTGELIAEVEAAQLPAKAEQADSTPLQDGLAIPEEIALRQERKAALPQARTEHEA